MENYSIDYDPPQMLKHKRKRATFNFRMDSILELPSEIVSKFTQSTFEEDFSLPILLEKSKLDKLDNKESISDLNDPSEKSEKLEKMSNLEISQECLALKEEIDEIANELEFFARKNRKEKMISLMYKIAESVDDSLIDIDELMDHYFLGNKLCNIEIAYLENHKVKVYENNQKLCEYTNRLLMDDDEEFFNKKS